MSKRRRQFREVEVLETLVAHQGVTIPCFRCKQPITDADIPANVEKEHLHEVGLDGPDEPFNCRFSHAECHAVVTNGTPATSAGSSKQRIAKTHGPRAAKFVVEKTPIVDDGPPSVSTKCRRCGDYSDQCECAAPTKPAGFRRAVRA